MTSDVIQFVVPSELELREFFGVEPVERSAEDGYWCYEATDVRGVKLRFSFHLFERSVQTELLIDDVPVVSVSHEGATRMRLERSDLCCEFSGEDWKAALVLVIDGVFRTDWSTLRMR